MVNVNLNLIKTMKAVLFMLIINQKGCNFCTIALKICNISDMNIILRI